MMVLGRATDRSLPAWFYLWLTIWSNLVYQIYGLALDILQVATSIRVWRFRPTSGWMLASRRGVIISLASLGVERPSPAALWCALCRERCGCNALLGWDGCTPLGAWVSIQTHGEWAV